MTPQEAEAIQLLAEARRLIKAKGNEAAIRHNLSFHLKSVVGTPVPWWAVEHYRKSESAVKALKKTGKVTNYIDNLVGLTAVEYEKNLTNSALFAEGYEQVRGYVASLLNTGATVTSVRGVLSDTVRWYAYDVAVVSPGVAATSITAADVTLKQIQHADCSAADLPAARALLLFMQQHLGRTGGQRLTAETLSEMFGVTEPSGAAFVSGAQAVVHAASTQDPAYAALVKQLWADFVSFVGAASTAHGFDPNAYASELYLLTLAKLIAANVINGSALASSYQEIQAILDGQYFRSRGLSNLVEYDYFGWLAKPTQRQPSPLQGFALAIQKALVAYDYSAVSPGDLFGPLISQLAKTTQRILLGQEPTPAWLVERVVTAVEQRIPAGAEPRYLDPCCGSGAFVVEVLNRRIRHPGFSALSREEKVRALSEVVQAFDLDPVAVMFAKVSWLIATKIALHPFALGTPVAIPIYHADSLFAIAPLARNVITNTGGGFDLEMDGTVVTLPAFLAEPGRQVFFDAFVDGLYRVASVLAQQSTAPVTAGQVQPCITQANPVPPLSAAETTAAIDFGIEFVGRLADLERNKRNGIWLHMLKNGYRPALVKDQFNAVATNFPWLALSKLQNNPYQVALKRRIGDYGLQPPAQSVLHVELATVFALHAVVHYLQDGGVLGAVVPNSIFQGTQHEPLRRGDYKGLPAGIPFEVQEVWDVDESAFTTNVAAVLVGTKTNQAPAGRTYRRVDAGVAPGSPLYTAVLGARTAWTSTAHATRAQQTHYEFKEGVDLFPRTAWFHEVVPALPKGGVAQVQVGPISPASALHYLVAKPKKLANFRATPNVMSERWVFPVLTSNHVVAFKCATTAPAVLPFTHRDPLGRVIVDEKPALIAPDAGAKSHFDSVFTALATVWDERPIDPAAVMERVTMVRKKVAMQGFAAGGATLVVFGAGGKIPCAAAVDLSAADADRLLVDQTLYWTAVAGPDEADFLVGLVNSDALAQAIRPFQPRGLEGERHVHSLVAQVLPRWNPANPAHAACLAATRKLMSELAALAAGNPQVNASLTVPTHHVNSRRATVRGYIQGLPNYAAYETACAAALP